MTKEDLQLLSDLMDEKLKPINNRLDKMDERLDKMDERLDNIEHDLKIVKVSTNALVEWTEAASKYGMVKLHFPLEEDEKVH